MYKILDNLATHGIEYNYDDNQYLISKDSVSEEEILTFSEATDEDANKWLIIDARILSDYKVNDMQDGSVEINNFSHKHQSFVIA